MVKQRPFAIVEEKNLDMLLDPAYFEAVLDKGFKQFFSFALASELSTSNGDRQPISVRREVTTRTYTADLVLARVLHGVFGITSFFAIVLLLLVRNRKLI